jgi:hypothetical protein
MSNLLEWSRPVTWCRTLNPTSSIFIHVVFGKMLYGLICMIDLVDFLLFSHHLIVCRIMVALKDKATHSGGYYTSPERVLIQTIIRITKPLFDC